MRTRKEDEYRRKAAECQTLASECKDEFTRELWLATAGTWLRMAELEVTAIEGVETTKH